ncbi:hypothetical protein [Paenibacillus elgii]|uniref:hypothetical protein n=1 Tax=Paenibacillus elgii TaxID=189691 RepID=UPI00203BB0C7|nr:hypothetical protein [Paenibacillus elgii]MCM3272602.1 hypothetical protein [Paenibacillus elgii]
MSEGVHIVRLIPVVDLETGEALEIDQETIYKTVTERNGIVLKCTNGKSYRFPRNQDELEDAWFHTGFRRLDSTNVVNMNHARVYDEKSGKIYFEDQPTKNSDFGNVAAIHSDYVIFEVSKEFGVKIIPARSELSIKMKSRSYVPRHNIAPQS